MNYNVIRKALEFFDPTDYEYRVIVTAIQHGLIDPDLDAKEAYNDAKEFVLDIMDDDLDEWITTFSRFGAQTVEDVKRMFMNTDFVFENRLMSVIDVVMDGYFAGFLPMDAEDLLRENDIEVLSSVGVISDRLKEVVGRKLRAASRQATPIVLITDMGNVSISWRPVITVGGLIEASFDNIDDLIDELEEYEIEIRRTQGL